MILISRCSECKHFRVNSFNDKTVYYSCVKSQYATCRTMMSKDNWDSTFEAEANDNLEKAEKLLIKNCPFKVLCNYKWLQFRNTDVPDIASPDYIEVPNMEKEV